MHLLSAEQVEALADAIEHPPIRRAGHGASPTGRHHFPEYAASPPTAASGLGRSPGYGYADSICSRGRLRSLRR